VLLAASVVSPVASALDSCAAFTWDLTLERALFSEAPNAQTAGREVQTAPTLAADVLYALQLNPQTEVSFVTAPGGEQHSPEAYGGLARFSASPPGTYRISADQPVWFDVVLNGKVMASRDFQGHTDCNAPQRVVEYDLLVADALTLQISGAASRTVRLTLTPAPPTAPESVPAAKP
jgi:hypothetical protein